MENSISYYEMPCRPGSVTLKTAEKLQCGTEMKEVKGKRKLQTESSCDLPQQNCEEDVQIIQEQLGQRVQTDGNISKQNERKKYECKYRKER